MSLCQHAIEAILRECVRRIDEHDMPRWAREMFSQQLIDGYKVYRFHKRDVVPPCIEAFDLSEHIVNACFNVNKHQLSYDKLTGWFTFKLIA